MINKATDDSEFRVSLLADPKAAINAELNVTIPEQLSVSVLEDSPTAVHLVLPPSTQINREAMKAMSGGGASSCNFWGGSCY